MRQRTWILLGIIVAIILGAYLVMTGGRPMRSAPEWLTAQKIAHRGQWTDNELRPENSLAAFAEAAANGYAVELDVHRSADGVAIIIHDDSVKAMTGEDGMVADMTLAQLKALSLAGGDEHIPTLEEALGVIGGRVPVFVEIKNEGEVGPLETDVADQLTAYDGDACVMSFNPFSLSAVRKAAPQIPRGQLSSAFDGEDLKGYEKFLLRNFMMNWTSRPDFIAYDIDDMPAASAALQRFRFKPVLGWTIDDAADLAFAADYCDGFICNPGALEE